MPPEPPPAADQGAFADALDRAGPLAGLHDGTGRPAPDRLDVYRNNVIVSLRDALATSFPATERLMGADFFAAAAVDFARAEKPASPLLFRYGAGFADALARLPGLAPYPFVPEVAAIEWARLCAYHAADAAPLSPEALAALPPDALPRLVLTAHPAARLVAAPAGGYGAWRANAGDAAANGTAAAGYDATAGVLVTRPRWQVLMTPLDATAMRLAAALLDGTALGDAAAAADTGGDLALAPTLAALLSAGALADP